MQTKYDNIIPSWRALFWSEWLGINVLTIVRMNKLCILHQNCHLYYGSNMLKLIKIVSQVTKATLQLHLKK